MAKNVCSKCGHGYSSKFHQTHCKGKSISRFRAERRVAARRSAGSRSTHRRSTGSYSFATTWDRGIVANMDVYRKDSVQPAQAAGQGTVGEVTHGR
jgi:hypothetical protein